MIIGSCGGLVLALTESEWNWHGWPPQTWNGNRWTYATSARRYFNPKIPIPPKRSLAQYEARRN